LINRCLPGAPGGVNWRLQADDPRGVLDVQNYRPPHHHHHHHHVRLLEVVKRNQHTVIAQYDSLIID